MCLKIFGPEVGTQLYPYIQASIACSIFVLTILVLGVEKLIGYQGMIFITMVSSFFAILFVFFIKEERFQYRLKESSSKLLDMEIS
jgi:Na+/melibiose symporter-like transporter